MCTRWVIWSIDAWAMKNIFNSFPFSFFLVFSASQRKPTKTNKSGTQKLNIKPVIWRLVLKFNSESWGLKKYIKFMGMGFEKNTLNVWQISSN